MSTVQEFTPTARIPVPLTTLIGREQEVAAAVAHLREGVRLLTLTGPAGVGKTRLAIAVGAELAAGFAHGAAFVPLASVREAGLVLTAVADALDIRGEGNRPIFERLAGELQQQHRLLVLDNFEQVAEAAPDLCRLLELCPTVSALVTSRVRLRVCGEHPVPVPPLPVPDPSHLSSLDRLHRNSSVRLFLARAAEVDQAFALGADNAAAIATICARLEGLPLAIELAAARLETLSPGALSARLDDRLTVLTRGPRDAAERHRTLRDAIAWSYELLSPAEQALFRGLAVFAGGCDSAAAEAVVGSPRLDATPDDIVNGLGRLLDHSLIQRQIAAGEPRFLMLESIREFGLEHLAALGEADRLGQRHVEYFLSLVSAADISTSPEFERRLSRLEREQDNLRAALAWATANDPVTALRLATALQHFWMARGSISEGRSWLDRALAAEGSVSPAVRADALNWASYFAFLQADFGSATARAEESLPLWRSSGDESGLARALSLLGNVAAAQEDLLTAIPFYDEALALHRAVGDPGEVGGVLANLGLTLGLTGDYERAATLLEEAVALCETAGEQRTTAIALLSLGEVVRMQGDARRAAMLLADALDRFQRDGDTTGGIAECWEGLAGVAASGDPIRAARLLGAASALRERIGHPLERALHARYDATLGAARAALDPAVFAAAWAAGRRLGVDQACAEALAIAEGPRQRQSYGERVATISHGLTPRELEVLRLLAAGHSDRQIAQMLFISPHTAMVHAKHIRRKLGVDSRAAVASYAVRVGLV